MSDDNLNEEPVQTLFRPSYSATFLNCEAALLDGRFYPDSAGQAAAEGTVFHEIMQEWLTTRRAPRHRLGTIAEVWKQDADRTKDKPFFVEIDDDMFFYGAECVRYIRRFPGKRLIEQRVDVSHLTPIPDQSGTLDVGFVSPGKAVIIDWKYGKGVRVFAEWNTQELMYLSGIFQEWDWLYDFQEFELHIAQPRLKHWDKFIIDRQGLIEWMDWARVRMAAAWKRKGRTYTVSAKACTWCKRRVDCRAKLAALEAVADEDFDRFTVSSKEAKEIEVFVPPKSMETTVLRLSTEEKVKIYGYRSLFERWFKMIGDNLLELGIEGADLGDYYVTEGRSFRRWKSEKEVVETVKLLGVPEDEMFERVIISPAKAEKVLRGYGLRGKALDEYVALLVDRPPGKPTLVRKGEDERVALDDYGDVFDAE